MKYLIFRHCYFPPHTINIEMTIKINEEYRCVDDGPIRAYWANGDIMEKILLTNLKHLYILNKPYTEKLIIRGEKEWKI